MSYKPGNTRL